VSDPADRTELTNSEVMPGSTFGPAEVATIDLPPSLRRGGTWRRFKRNRLALFGLAMIVLIILAALFAELITKYDPAQIDTSNRRQPPSGEHWFGTDQIGRDTFSRVIFGARVSLRVGIFATLIAVVIGVVAGSLAGYYGGIVDSIVMRLTDLFLAFPYLLAALAIITVIGRGERTVIIVLGLLGWLAIARVLRSQILQVKEREFIEAARAVGASDLRIITRHILPNSIQPVIVYATLFLGAAVLSEAALSFLGVGIQDPTPAWGLMVAQGRRYLVPSPHLLFFPGAAIFVMVTAFVFVGDGLRDALDPKLK
jgi:peptide/nickel transport system permease protein